MRNKAYWLFGILVIFFFNAHSQTLYTKAYGDHKNPAIIYVHGGPRGNSTLFEATTAQSLSEKGFYVIVYDRRGEGRSIDTDATFTFQEAFNDLNNLITKYALKKVTIIGHSFGGIVSTLYTQANLEKVERLILVGALFSQQETYNHIITSVKKHAELTRDTATLNKINFIKDLPKNGADYRKKVYEIASRYNYFSMPSPTDESRLANKKYEQSEFSAKNIRNDLAPLLFYKNEKLVNIDTKTILRKIKSNHVKLFAIYGNQDQIFSEKQISDVKNIVTENHFYGIENCSHYPFVDQQKIFLMNMEHIMKNP